MVSYYAPEVISISLKVWLDIQGIRTVKLPPCNLSSNGLAERVVNIKEDYEGIQSHHTSLQNAPKVVTETLLLVEQKHLQRSYLVEKYVTGR